jgi:mannitol-1-phosphate 5-dehydrogenase
MKKAVHFGAGNIGRGFIGLLLAQSGHEVTFVDVNKEVLDQLNERGRYPVRLAGASEKTLWVEHVRGIDSRDQEALNQAIQETEVITTAVGVNILPIVGKSIAASLESLFRRMPAKTWNILACENAVGNGDLLKKAVYQNLSSEGQTFCDTNVGFPNTTVDRIVPENKDQELPLLVLVEPFFEWNVEKQRVVGHLPEIAGLTLVDNLEAYIERKLFTLNTGHAIAAYLGYQRSCATIVEAVSQPEIREIVLGAMREAGRALVKKHEFDPVMHETYIQKIMSRFENPALADPVERVGRDPLRKLGARDRLIAPTRAALAYGEDPVFLVKGIVAALHFNDPNDEAAVTLSNLLKQEGLKAVLLQVCELTEDEPLFLRIMKEFQ